MDKIIFQYCRVSTSEQSSEGNGLDNQKRQNEAYIKALIDNDPSLIRKDDIEEVGSAFSGNNFTKVLDKLKAGEIPKDSIVVMFDHTRFSREDPLDALVKLREVVRSGLNVGFSTKQELITPETINTFNHYIAHFVSTATANEESQNRSNRTLASYNRKVELGGLVLSGALPNWIKKVYNEGNVIDIALIPERAELINKIFNLYLEGQGATTIVKWLNENEEVWLEHHNRVRANKNVNKLADRWTESYVTRLLTDKRLIGERIFNLGKTNESVKEDYYPQVITNTKFYAAQEIRKNRSRSPSVKKYPPVIFMGIAKCGYCGGRIAVQQYKDKRPVIRCARHSKGEENLCAGGSSPARYLEKVLIELCRDKINYDLLYQPIDIGENKLKVQIRSLENEQSETEQKLTRLEELYLISGIDLDKYLKYKEDIDEVLSNTKPKLRELKDKLAQFKAKSTSDDKTFQDLVNYVAVDEIPTEIRLKLKALLPEYIQRIDVYRYGLFAKPKVTDKEYKSLIEQYGRNHFKVIKVTPIKDKSMLLYRIIFKSGGGSRYVLYNAGDWKYVDHTQEVLKTVGASLPEDILFSNKDK
ncbi:MAG: recombinase family protein [Thalassotalea sp.]